MGTLPHAGRCAPGTHDHHRRRPRGGAPPDDDQEVGRLAAGIGTRGHPADAAGEAALAGWWRRS
jgi:hypothetical protein